MNYFIRNLILGSAVAVLAFGAAAFCSGMVNADTKIPIDEAHFPDKAFREDLKNHYDENEDGFFSSAEIKDIDAFSFIDYDIRDLAGIEYFTNLEYLEILYCDLTKLDVSKNLKLNCLNIEENKLTKLDVSKNLNLEYLICNDNKLTKLDVSKNTKLLELQCELNPIEALDLSNNPKLERLQCGDIKITSLDVSNNSKLEILCTENLGLTELDFSKCKGLEYLDVSGNKLKSLPVSGYKKLWSLSCGNNELETLNLSGCTKLTNLICNDNKLKTLDVSSSSNLGELRCQGNKIKTLNLGNCKNLALAYGGIEEDKDGYVTYTSDDFDDYTICVDKDTVITVEPLIIDDSFNNKVLSLACGRILSPQIDGSNKATQVKSSDTSVIKVIKGNTILVLKVGYSTITVIAGGKEYKFKIKALYEDVTDSSKFWFEPTYALTEKGVVKGYYDQTEFKPGYDCTRAQMVTFLWRLAGSPEPKTNKCKFSDVDDEEYYYEPVIWAVENGITTGYSDGKFKPYNSCTRAQAVTFLWRMAGKPEPGKKAKKFSDVKETDYYYKATLWASDKKILAGYDDGTFRPKGKCLRRQMVTFLYKYDRYVNAK